MKPFFSVVIPTLNEEKYIPFLLHDLEMQKEKNFEVIVTDGNSKDKTGKVVLKFKNVIPVSFYKNERKNVSYQRNFGASKAQGRYLVFLDADSRLNKYFMGNLKKNILKKKGLVFLPYILPGEHDSQTKLIFKIVNFIVEQSQNIGKPISFCGDMIWDKNFFKTVGGFDELLYLAEDHNIIRRAYIWGVRTKYLHKIYVKFSLRRMKNEGRLSVFYKALVGTGYFMLKGDIKKNIFEYKMGGESINKIEYNKLFKQNLKKYLKHINKFFKQYLT